MYAQLFLLLLLCLLSSAAEPPDCQGSSFLDEGYKPRFFGGHRINGTMPMKTLQLTSVFGCSAACNRTTSCVAASFSLLEESNPNCRLWNLAHIAKYIERDVTSHAVVHLPMYCNETSAVDGQWSVWRDAGECSVSCGSGVQMQNRSCDSPAQFCNGNPCSAGPMTQSVTCNENPCPVDGAWAEWSPWSHCSETCGSGFRSIQRVCDGPAHGGSDCVGDDSTTKECLIEPCSQHVVTELEVVYDDVIATCAAEGKVVASMSEAELIELKPQLQEDAWFWVKISDIHDNCPTGFKFCISTHPSNDLIMCCITSLPYNVICQ